MASALCAHLRGVAASHSHLSWGAARAALTPLSRGVLQHALGGCGEEPSTSFSVGALSGRGGRQPLAPSAPRGLRAASFLAGHPIADTFGGVRGSQTQAAGEQDVVHRNFDGVFVDAAGTLLVPSEPAAEVYLRYGAKYGVNLSEEEILQRFRRSYNRPWKESSIRYVGDGKPFWRYIVAESTGVENEDMFEAIYDYYSHKEAWDLTPGAVDALKRLKGAGVRIAVVSNFDTRLRPILEELGILDLFDAVVVSAEVSAEKPNPVIFDAAIDALDMPPERILHVGDDRRNDVWGARDAGVFALLWGTDVDDFADVADLVLGRECQ